MSQDGILLSVVLLYVLTIEMGGIYRIAKLERILAKPKPREIGAVRLWRTFLAFNLAGFSAWIVVIKFVVAGLGWLVTPQGVRE